MKTKVSSLFVFRLMRPPSSVTNGIKASNCITMQKEVAFMVHLLSSKIYDLTNHRSPSIYFYFLTFLFCSYYVLNCIFVPLQNCLKYKSCNSHNSKFKKKEQRIKRVLLSYIEALEMEHFFGNNRGSKECFYRS